jgi:hypothetical protein
MASQPALSIVASEQLDLAKSEASALTNGGHSMARGHDEAEAPEASYGAAMPDANAPHRATQPRFTLLSYQGSDRQTDSGNRHQERAAAAKFCNNQAELARSQQVMVKRTVQHQAPSHQMARALQAKDLWVCQTLRLIWRRIRESCRPSCAASKTQIPGEVIVTSNGMEYDLRRISPGFVTPIANVTLLAT